MNTGNTSLTADGTQPLAGSIAGKIVIDWNAYKAEVQKVMVGLDEIVDLAGFAFLADGHLLLEALPGAGKTTLAEALSAAIKGGRGGFFAGSADLMPMDIIGSKAFNPETRKLEIQFGIVKPDFNVLVADEINRLAPKTASVLLGVLQERRLNIQGENFALSDSFLTIATQNPIEQEGVYPMPEALADRFGARSNIKRLSRELEIELIRRVSIKARNQAQAAGVVPVLTPERLVEMRKYAQNLAVELSVSGYIADLVRATNPDCEEFGAMSNDYNDLVVAGSGLRGSIWLDSFAKSHAALRGSDRVMIEDVQAVAPFVLQHRITLKPDVKFSGRKGVEEEIVRSLLETVPTVGGAIRRESAVITAAESRDRAAAVSTEGAPKRAWWKFGFGK